MDEDLVDYEKVIQKKLIRSCSCYNEYLVEYLGNDFIGRYITTKITLSEFLNLVSIWQALNCEFLEPFFAYSVNSKMQFLYLIQYDKCETMTFENYLLGPDQNEYEIISQLLSVILY